MYLKEEDKFSQLQYDIYKQFCIENGITPLDIDHFKTIDQENVEFKSKENEHLSLLGKAGVSINAGLIYDAAKQGFKRWRDNKGDFKATIKDLKGDAANYIGDVVNDFIGGEKSDVKINTDINGGGGNFNTNKYNSSTTPLGNSNSLISNLNRNPVEVSLDTGIAPRATYQLDLYPSDAYSPLHISIGELTLDNLPNDKEMNDYVNNVIMFDFQNRAQSEVNFDIISSNAFSATNLVKLFNTQIYLLNTIYNVLSITGYSSDPLNRNLGLRSLRSLIDPNLINQVSIAMELIAGTPVPPNLKSICHWFNGNFNQSSLANSPAIKFLCVEPANYANQMSERISDGISRLQALRSTSSILARVVKNDPGWYSMPHYSSEVLHDANFTTLFSNAPYFVNGQVKMDVYNIDKNFNYITFGAADGGALGFTTKRIQNDGNLFGLMGFNFNGVNPIDTRWSVVNDNGDYVFQPSWMDVNNAFSRGEIQAIYASDVSTNPPIKSKSHVRFGSEMLEQISFSSIRENERQIIRHLLSIDRIKSKDARMESKPKGKRYPSKRK